MHACGLRQGDSMSPLLFVIAMDVLTAMVMKAQEINAISKIPDLAPIQRLSLYADDVVMFIRPWRSDLWFVQEALRIFGEASGLKVDFTKSSAVMIRSEDAEEELVRQSLPWKLETFPIRYLGLQLGIKQLSRSEWQPIVDNVLKMMPG